MGLNWKETERILSELPLEGSYIQRITEHSVNSFTFSMYSRTEKAWLLYVEVSSPYARICRTERMRPKTKRMQRFTQYMNAHIVGKRIAGVWQYPYDRAFRLTLSSSEETLEMHIRLFSGPGANIIITSSSGIIQELLYRRPNRGEENGKPLAIDIRQDEGSRHYDIRPYTTATLSEAIDSGMSQEASDSMREDLLERLTEKRDRELAALRERRQRQMAREKETSGYEETRRAADILSASLFMVQKGMKSIELDDWERGGRITIALDASLSPNENLERLYQRYRKDRKASEMAREEIERTEAEIRETEERYRTLLDGASDEKLRKAMEKAPDSRKDGSGKRPGLWLTVRGFDMIVGRSAKENDEILRTHARGSDLWLHTRDYAGGYVIIKAQRGKTVPLPVLLDAASLAIHYSKAKKSGRADLYYTQVKYLRRAKDGKQGLVLPTQERNLSAVLDEERVREILR